MSVFLAHQNQETSDEHNLIVAVSRMPWEQFIPQMELLLGNYSSRDPRQRHMRNHLERAIEVKIRRSIMNIEGEIDIHQAIDPLSGERHYTFEPPIDAENFPLMAREIDHFIRLHFTNRRNSIVDSLHYGLLQAARRWGTPSGVVRRTGESDEEFTRRQARLTITEEDIRRVLERQHRRLTAGMIFGTHEKQDPNVICSVCQRPVHHPDNVKQYEEKYRLCCNCRTNLRIMCGMPKAGFHAVFRIPLSPIQEERMKMIFFQKVE